MDQHIRDFFSQSLGTTSKGNFYKVIELGELIDDWDFLSKQYPLLPRGWYELSQLLTEDRLAFSYEYWLSKLPFQPHLDEGLQRFFSSLEDITIFLTQKNSKDIFEPHMVYVFKEGRGFFRGGMPAREKEIVELTEFFSSVTLPADFIAFLQIHNGFCKATDATGLFSCRKMMEVYDQFQRLVEEQPSVAKCQQKIVDPRGLIPFYESFGMPYFQCFWKEWYPGQEMGNVYYASDSNTISGVDEKETGSPELLAFPIFTDWLLFYLEEVS